MGAPGGPKTGGRQKGTPNRTSSARYAAMARVNEALAALGEDTLTGMKLLKEVLNHKDTPLDVKIQCAALLLKDEKTPEGEARYVCIMPPPIADLEEWKRQYMTASPAADEKQVEWAEKVAKASLEQQKAREATKGVPTAPPWEDNNE